MQRRFAQTFPQIATIAHIVMHTKRPTVRWYPMCYRLSENLMNATIDPPAPAIQRPEPQPILREASPAAPAQPGPQLVEYRQMDTRKARLSELCGAGGIVGGTLVWALGRIGINLSPGCAICIADWSKFEVGFATLPEDVQEKLKPRIAAFLELGGTLAVFARVKNESTGAERFVMLNAEPEENWMGVTVLLRSPISNGAKIKHASTSILTAFGDGQFLETLGHAPELAESAKRKYNRIDNRGIPALLAAHQKALAERDGGKGSYVVEGNPYLWEIFRLSEEESRNEEIARGILAATPEKIAHSSPPASLQSGGPTHTVTDWGAERAWAVLQESASKKSSSKVGAVLLLLGSLALFYFAGRSGSTTAYIVSLLVVLFVHEAGHYIAMRAFGYRELRMFFLPFFGAAVSGKNFNVPGWKKAVVSLAGPVPGIFIGGALGTWAAWNGHDSLAKGCLLAIILNAGNLIPVHPLDGGWFWEHILFCRHKFLEIGFRIFAIVGCLALGAIVSKIFIYIGISLVLGMPLLLMRQRVAAEVRQRGIGRHAGEDDCIPRPTADAIFTALRADKNSKAVATDQALAKVTLDVFEHMNTTPPNWLASIAFAGTWVGSLVASVVGIAAIISIGGAGVADLGGTPDAESAAEIEELARDKRVFEPVAYDVQKPVFAQTQKPNPFPYGYEMVGMFPTVPAAGAASSQLLVSQPGVLISQLGNSVIVHVPGRKKSVAKFAAAKMTALQGRILGETDGASFRLTTTAPTAAVATVRQEIEGWMNLNLYGAPEPWRAGTTSRVPLPTLRRIYRTEGALKDETTLISQSPEELRKSRLFLFRTILRMSPTMDNSAQNKAIQKLLAVPGEQYDRAFLLLMLEQPQFTIRRDEGYQELAKKRTEWQARVKNMLGVEASVPTLNDDDADEDEDDSQPFRPESWVSASTSPDGRLEITGSSNDPASFLANLASWLHAEGCTKTEIGWAENADGEEE